jgi:hypothetical protein
VLDRASRFVVAHTSGPYDETLVTSAIIRTYRRTAGRAFAWYADGFHGYGFVLRRLYRFLLHTGTPGRPPWALPPDLALTQTIKQRDARGRIVHIEHRATIGELLPRPGTMQVERFNGVLRDHLNCLTRKTHAFAKSHRTWRAVVGLEIFAHNWMTQPDALRRPSMTPGRVYDRRSPAMALGVTDHCWSWTELLTMSRHIRC